MIEKKKKNQVRSISNLSLKQYKDDNQMKYYKSILVHMRCPYKLMVNDTNGT